MSNLPLRKIPAWLVNAILVSLTIAGLSAAVQANGYELEEITVTAQKREQGLQDVPLALTAFQADFIDNTHTELIDDLAKYTPSLTLQNSTQGEPNIYIRGIGSNNYGVGGDTSVGVFIDDIYVGRIHGSISDLADAERVEILKGPQGTLLGRNTIGGAINVTTKNPSEMTAGHLKIEGGSYNKRRIDGSIEGAVTDTTNVRLSGLINKRDGWKENDYDNSSVENENNSAVKLTAVYAPQDNFSATLKLGYDDLDIIARGPQSSNPLYSNGNAFDDIYSDLGNDAKEARELWDASLHLNWDRDDYALKSITGYRNTDYKSRKDTTGTGSRDTSLHTNTNMQAEQFSQEFRLNYDNNGDFIWFIGTSIFYEDVTQGSILESTNETIKNIGPTVDPSFTLLGLAAYFPDGENYYESLNNGGQYYSYAAYGDATWDFSDSLALTLGLRYTQDDKKHFIESYGPTPVKPLLGGLFNFPGVVYKTEDKVNSKKSWNAWTPRAVLNWTMSDTSKLYGSISRGYKSGGFNSFSPNNSFNPEYVWSYEAGLKSSLLENRLTLNAALFFYDYKDLQVNNIEGAVVVLRNAGKAQGQGLEFDATWMMSENWQLLVSGNYLEATFKEFTPAIGGVSTDLADKTMPLAPEFKLSVSLAHNQHLSNGDTVDYRLSYSWTDEYYFDIGNTPDEYQSNFALIDARIAWTSPNERWTVAVFGQNLTDVDYMTYAGGQAKYDLNAPIYVGAIGRTLGANADYRF